MPSTLFNQFSPLRAARGGGDEVSTLSEQNNKALWFTLALSSLRLDVAPINRKYRRGSFNEVKLNQED